MATAFAAPQYGPQPEAVQQVTQQWAPTSDFQTQSPFHFQTSAFASTSSVDQWASVNHHGNNVAVQPSRQNIEEVQRQWEKFIEYELDSTFNNNILTRRFVINS